LARCLGFDRTEFEKFAEHLARGNWLTASAVMNVLRTPEKTGWRKWNRIKICVVY
jgi:hypothetical protein